MTDLPDLAAKPKCEAGVGRRGFRNGYTRSPAKSAHRAAKTRAGEKKKIRPRGERKKSHSTGGLSVLLEEKKKCAARQPGTNGGRKRRGEGVTRQWMEMIAQENLPDEESAETWWWPRRDRGRGEKMKGTSQNL